MKAYHVSEHRGETHFIYAEGARQWFGDGYYFWQDYEFALEWISVKGYEKADVYTVDLDLIFGNKQDDNIIDTVFNEEDYYKFIEKVEYFAKKYKENFGRKPTLIEFNNFIKDNHIWEEFVAIRFQDLPSNDYRDYLEIKEFYYKKRIQIIVFEFSKIEDYMVQTISKNPK